MVFWKRRTIRKVDMAQETPPAPNRPVQGTVSWSTDDRVWCVDLAAGADSLPANQVLDAAFAEYFHALGRFYYLGEAGHEFLVIQPRLPDARYNARTEQAILYRLRSRYAVYPPTGQPINWRPEPYFGSFWWLRREKSWVITVIDDAGHAVSIDRIVNDPQRLEADLAEIDVVCWVSILSDRSAILLHSSSSEHNENKGEQIKLVLLKKYSRSGQDGRSVEWNLGQPT